MPNITETRTDFNWEEWDHQEPFYIHTISGISAGITEHCVMFPFDTIKTNLQVNKKRQNPLKFRGTTRRIIQNRGILKLWNGVASLFLGCIPAHAIYFTVFEETKYLTRNNKFGDSITGITASCLHDLIMVPVDCIKQRLQLGKYNGKLSLAFIRIVEKEGFFALYRSYPTTLLMNIPYSAIMMPCNEHFKRIFNPSGKINLPVFFLSGSFSALIAAAVTCPLDVCKTRLQTQNVNVVTKLLKLHKSTGPIDYTSRYCMKYVPYSQLPNIANPHQRYYGLYDTALKIFKYEGMAGFYKGVFPRIMYVFPGSGLSWCVYESVKRLFIKQIN